MIIKFREIHYKNHADCYSFIVPGTNFKVVVFRYLATDKWVCRCYYGIASSFHKLNTKDLDEAKNTSLDLLLQFSEEVLREQRLVSNLLNNDYKVA